MNVLVLQVKLIVILLDYCTSDSVRVLDRSSLTDGTLSMIIDIMIA